MEEKTGERRPFPELLHLCCGRNAELAGKLQPHLQGLPQRTSMYLSRSGLPNRHGASRGLPFVGITSALLETITSNFLLLNSYQKPDSKNVSEEDLPEGQTGHARGEVI